jgi:hypothetical protein
MAYDTTLAETLTPAPRAPELPECLKRDRLNAGYFAQMTAVQFAAVVALAVIFLWTSLHKLNHTDLWGHLDLGRWMVRHQALPAIDPFAASPSAMPFIPSAWLSQVLGFLTIDTLGLEGLVLGHALLATLACGAMMLAIRARGVTLCWAIAGGAAYYLLSLPIVGTIRPQLFGMLGAPLALLALAQLPRSRAPLVWLPLLFCAWANLHGSFAMGLAMLVLGAVGVTGQVLGERRSLRAAVSDVVTVRMWAAVGLCLLAASLNPSGPKLLAMVLGFGQNATLASISEWRSLPLASISGGLFFTSLIVGGVCLRFSQRRWEMSDLLLLALFGLATLGAMRMLAWWAAVWPFAILPYAVSAWQTRFGSADDEAAPPANAMRTVLALGVVFMTLLLSPATNNLLLGRERGIGAVASSGTPIYVADEIARRGLKGNFYSPMDWADYIVWEQPDGLRPLVYSHVHLLAPEAWTDYQQIDAGAPDWITIADKHRLRYLVIGKQRSPTLARSVVTYAGQRQSRAAIIYQDQHALLVELQR